jgi:predicted ATP-dependent endonuclease of OLD family
MPETQKAESLRIVSLHASNVKKLKAVTITPKGNVVTLTGANGAGKSSVLDSIWYALGGKDGISFDEFGVLLNGLPFTQASTGEQLRVSVAVGMALNPRLRVIFIRDGSLIDDAGLALIAELAQKNDYQVWLETVHSKDPTAVVIEDGEVKEATV